MHYIIYRTTNLIDQKFYIGKHQTLNLNDNYLGSGIHLRRAIKKISESISKYGNKRFTEEGRKKIRESNKNRPITDEFRKKMSIIAKNRHKIPMTEETKNKIRTSLKNFYKNKNAVCEKSGISGVS
jgi:hypothetical protein